MGKVRPIARSSLAQFELKGKALALVKLKPLLSPSQN